MKKDSSISIPNQPLNNFKNEYKYPISLYEKMRISKKISGIIKSSESSVNKGSYKIRSLYYNDINNSLVNTEFPGRGYSEKFRMRIYDNDLNTIRIEKKTRINNLTKKSVAFISREECRKILNNDIDFLSESDNIVLKEFHDKLKSEYLIPSLIVEHNREANVLSPDNIRVTFDSEINVCFETTEFLNRYVKFQTTNSGILMHIKSSTQYPQELCDIITPKNNLLASKNTIKNLLNLKSKLKYSNN